MNGRSAINRVLQGEKPSRIFREVTEADSPSPSPSPGKDKGKGKPFPGAATPFESRRERAGQVEDSGYKPGDRGDEGMPGKNEPGDDDDDDDEDEETPSPEDKQEEAKRFLKRCHEEYGIAGGDHDPDTQSPRTPAEGDLDDDSPGDDDED